MKALMLPLAAFLRAAYFTANLLEQPGIGVEAQRP